MIEPTQQLVSTKQFFFALLIAPVGGWVKQSVKQSVN